MLHDPELHYLDNAATTIVAPEVADVIDKAMREHWANPSSLYAPGARSEEALNAARAAVARTLGCKSKELYFTSCGSEGNNLALLGAAQTRTFGKGIVVSGFEHPSVQRPLERLAAQGYNVTVVKPQADGTLDINKMLDAVDKNTILVACMMVNNEIGTRNDVERLAAAPSNAALNSLLCPAAPDIRLFIARKNAYSPAVRKVAFMVLPTVLNRPRMPFVAFCHCFSLSLAACACARFSAAAARSAAAVFFASARSAAATARCRARSSAAAALASAASCLALERSAAAAIFSCARCCACAAFAEAASVSMRKTSCA